MQRFRAILIIEFLILCVAVPGYIIFSRSAPYMFAFLWAAALYAFVILRIYHFEGWAKFWNWGAVTIKNLKPILFRWAVAVAGMIAFLQWYEPSNLFNLWHTRPEIIPYILLVYPVLSALPQEFVFCSFFFTRYKTLFGSGAWMVAASAIVFAYAHILYINPVAPVLSLAGGIIFAMTYRAHKSLALVTIEHALYGNALFLIGLGPYFFSGNVSG